MKDIYANIFYMTRALTMVTLFFLTSCINTKNSMVKFPGFDKEGHRGCRGLMPENTLSAMITAVQLGVTTLEMDVSFTADQKAILSHEPFFNHEITTTPDGKYITEQEETKFNIYRMSYDEVNQYDVGMKAHPRFPRQQKMKAVKPLMGEVIDSIEAYVKQKKLTAVWYNIETKTKPETDNLYHPEPGVFVDWLLGIIIEKNIQDRVIIQSFDIRTLQYLHKKFPGVKSSLLIELAEKVSVQDKIVLLGFTPFIVSPEYPMITPELVQYAHSQKMKIVPWTVNEIGSIEKLRKMNVDGIITDYPDLFDH